MPTVYKIHPEIEKEWLDFSITNILKQSNSGKSWIENNISHQNPSYSICHIKRNIKKETMKICFQQPIISNGK